MAIALAATSASTFAAEQEGFYIGAFGDYYDASWKNMREQAGLDVNESTGWGAELGYRFNDYWSARLEYADLYFNAHDKVLNNRNTINGARYANDALYHIGGGPFYGLFGRKDIDVFVDNLFLIAG